MGYQPGGFPARCISSYVARKLLCAEPHYSCLVGLVGLVTSGGCVSVATISASRDSRVCELMVGIYFHVVLGAVGSGNER